MKKILNLITILIVSNIVISCYSDRGNYNYSEISEVEIKNDRKFGEVLDSTITLISGVDTLKISPDIDVKNGNINTLEYRWLAQGSTLINLEWNTKELVYPINLPTDTYVFYLIIKDKSTNVEYSASWRVKINDLYSSGFLLLSADKENCARLDMIATSSVDTTLLYDITSITGLPKLKGPLSLFMGNRMDKNIYICTEEGALFIDPVTLTWDSEVGNLRYKMYATDYITDCKVTHITDPYNWRNVIVDGSAFCTNSSAAGVYNYPINRYKGKLETFNIAEKYAINYNKYNTSLSVYYNTDEKRFVRSEQKTTPSFMDSLINTKDDVKIFDWKTGLDYVTTEYSYYGNGENSTILTDNSGKYYLYRYEFTTVYAITKKGRYDISDAKDIAKAKFFYFSAKQPYFFYAVGNKVYGYDFQNGRNSCFEKDMGAEVTMISDNPYRYSKEKGTDMIYIATYNGNENGGKIEKFQVSNNPNKTEIVSLDISWSGFEKVVYMLEKSK